MNKLCIVLSAVHLSLVGVAATFEHCLFDSVSLDGAWEMAYRPEAYATETYPDFTGAVVTNAVPGYWEDLTDAFCAAGIKGDFRWNPWYERQTYPIRGGARDLTLPDIYGCFLYRRTINLDRTGPAVLRFEGVRNQVHAWVNGRFVRFRAGFSTPFELALPDGVLRKGTNEIVLAVSNNPNPGYDDFVSGLTTRAVFRSTGGVNGKLELRLLKGALGDVYVTTALDLKTFTVHVSGTDSYAYVISDGLRVLAKGAASGDVTLSTAGFDFWSPENPKRYDLRIQTNAGSFSQPFGLRRLVADGEKFRLNGRPVYLRGVTEHCYFAKTIHLPRDLGYYRMVTSRRKELGFNFVRFHTFVPPVEYLEATDELGMLVHIESPNFVTESEYAAIVAFARRHPSVVIYCTGNETRIDRLAERYLAAVAGLVHEGTDALFSPMSAMRGVEYHLIPGKDAIVDGPFPHNSERMARLARFCDMWTSYQLGVTSYASLDFGTPDELDAWGEVYRGKPRTSHEICIDGSYADLSLEQLYDANSPVLKSGLFSGIREQLRQKGVLDRADVYFRNSCEWMRRVRKHCFEKLRAADRVAGYDFLGDINTHWHTFGYSVGMMDEFYRLKPGETVENVRRYNSAAVLLCDLGRDFNVTTGTKKKIAFSISNYADEAPDATLTVRLVGRADLRGGRGWDGERPSQDMFVQTFGLKAVSNGRVTKLAVCDVPIPEGGEPKKYLLRAEFTGGGVRASNEWELYAFPGVTRPTNPTRARVVEDVTEDELVASMAQGERVLLLGAGPFKSLPTSYRIGLAGRCEGNYATVIKAEHPALRGLPKENFCGWNFQRLMENGRAVQLETDVPFDPIIDIASSVKCVIRQALLFEYRVGEGRLMVCSFRFREDDPAAVWLRNRLTEYADSDAFAPKKRISAAQLRALVNAPLQTGASNDNRARNPNDPSSAVRAGESARP